MWTTYPKYFVSNFIDALWKLDFIYRKLQDSNEIHLTHSNFVTIGMQAANYDDILQLQTLKLINVTLAKSTNKHLSLTIKAADNYQVRTHTYEQVKQMALVNLSQSVSFTSLYPSIKDDLCKSKENEEIKTEPNIDNNTHVNDDTNDFIQEHSNLYLEEKKNTEVIDTQLREKYEQLFKTNKDLLTQLQDKEKQISKLQSKVDELLLDNTDLLLHLSQLRTSSSINPTQVIKTNMAVLTNKIIMSLVNLPTNIISNKEIINAVVNTENQMLQDFNG